MGRTSRSACCASWVSSEAKRIGVEKRGFFYTVDEHETLCRGLPTDGASSTRTEILWNARMIKSDEEIAIMRRSAALVDMAMLRGLRGVAAGRERRPDQRRSSTGRCSRTAASTWGCRPSCSRANGAACRIRPAAPIGSAGDDVMYFEISASQRRYAAALMRTIFLGQPKDEWLRAAEACIDAVDGRDGRPSSRASRRTTPTLRRAP